MATRKERVFYELTATDNASRVFLTVEGSANRLRNSYLQLTGAVSALASAGFIAAAVRAAVEAEKASNRLTAALRATGGVAGVTRKEIDSLADSLADSSMFDDEQIRNAAAELTKFGNIQGKIFREGLKLSADLAAFMGTDASAGAQLIGKALQSPTEGLTALERQFGKLTEAQEANIKSLVAQGRAYEAQLAVLDIVQQKVGGTAELMNSGLTRATNDVRKAWNELLETMGARGMLLTPQMAGAATLMKDIKAELEGVRTPLRDLAADTLTWLEHLRFVPGVVGMIGKAAQNVRLLDDENRRTVSGKIRNPALEEWSAFEASLANVPARPLVLGGSAGGADRSTAADALREAIFRAEKTVELGEMAAQDSREAWQHYTDARLTQEKQLKDGREKMMRDWFDTIDREQEEAIEQGQEYLEGLRAITDEAGRFSGAIDNAFDRAVRGGENAIDIVKNLLRELAMIEIQRRIFEPASRALSAGLDSFIGGMFGGGRGSQLAGPAVAGIPGYAMGTDYVPRTGLALVHQGEKITPAGQNGGAVTVVQHINVDSRADRASILQAMNVAKEQAKAEIQESLQRGSSRFRSP